MRIAETVLPQYDHECALTRKLLARVPETQAAFRPHPKSMSVGELAMHIASIARWAVPTLTKPEIDVAGPERASMSPPAFTTTKDLLAQLDEATAKARAALEPRTDDEMRATWTLRAGTNVIFAQPRIGVFRGFIISHTIHHRGQLEVSLRMLGVPLPSIYGPSGDEAA
jgi:uncharacterized damage-inducible protein DinB